MKNLMTDTLLFFRAWLGAPLRVASLIPSSESLAGLITTGIGPDSGPLLELGPGTGVFTRALLQRGVAEADLTLIEAGPDFAALMSDRFPAARVHNMDAGQLHRLNETGPRLHGAAISGLPLLSMPKGQVLGILAGCFALLRDGAALNQFTYGPRCPIAPSVLARLGLRTQRVGHTYRNFPPATVWRITRRKDHAA
ncbi:MAG: SAM-dependent methyltransferase [Hyphomicrobiales bacterium]|nr:MAG: SAM-dependent methyltransferase [Hyphomicrobiales bacterium]